jgi:O-antigen ligase
VSSAERLLAFLLGAVSVGALAVADGGFFPSTWPWATIALAAAAGIAVVLRQHLTVAHSGLLAYAALAAFTGWTALSALWSPEPGQSLQEAERALVYLSGLLAALLALRAEGLTSLVAGIAAAATALAAFSIGVDREDAGSLEGPIGYANALAILLVVGLLCLLGLAWSHRGAPRIAAAAAGAVVFAALVLTESRGAWVALAVGALAVIALTSPRVAVVALPLVAAGVAAVATGIDLGDRPHYWRAALEQYRDHALTGSGAGTFDDYWLVYRPDDLTVLDTPQVLDAHSLYLESLAELGPVGLALIAVAVATPLLAARTAWREHRFLVAAYVAFLVHAGLDWDWEMPVVTVAALLCAACLLVAARGAPVELDRRARIALLGVIAILIASSLASALA